MWSIWLEANLCRFLSFVYICIAVGDPVTKRVRIPLTGDICACVPRNSNVLCGCLPLFLSVNSTIIVRFVDIGRIVDHHCLNFLFTFFFIFNVCRFNDKPPSVTKDDNSSIPVQYEYLPFPMIFVSLVTNGEVQVLQRFRFVCFSVCSTLW